MAMKGGSEPKTPDWMTGGESGFKGIWIPRESASSASLHDELHGVSFSDPEIWRIVTDFFKAYHLDPADPFHWQELIFKLAYKHWEQQPGAETVWTETRLCFLAADVELAQAQSSKRSKTKTTDIEICKMLVAGKIKPLSQDAGVVARFRSYKGKSLKTLRRRLPEARQRLADLFVALMPYMRDGTTWTADDVVRASLWISSLLAVGGYPHQLWFLRANLRTMFLEAIAREYPALITRK